MKRLWILALLAVSCFAAGTVQQTLTRLGETNRYVVAFQWTGDASSGSVPATVADIKNCCQGWTFTNVTIKPGSPAPTAGYAVKITDSSGADVLAGAAASLSATDSVTYAASSDAAPVNGSFSLVLTGNSVASAKGTVLVYLEKPGTVNMASFRGSTLGVNAVLGKLNLTTLGRVPYVGPSSGYLKSEAGFAYDETANRLTVEKATAAVTDKGGQVFNVKAYGATGDGATDDTAAIQAAITAGGGATVLLPPGDYKVAGTLLMPTGGTILEGAGIGLTTVTQATANANTISVNAGGASPIYNVQVRGFTIVDAGSTTSGDALKIENCSYCKFSLNVSGSYNAIHIQASNFVDLLDSRIFAPVNAGIVIDGSPASGAITANTIDIIGSASKPAFGLIISTVSGFFSQRVQIYAANYGIAINPQAGQTVADVFFDNLMVDTCTINGIQIQPGHATGAVKKLYFVNSWSATNGAAGIYVDASLGSVDGFSFSNGTVFNNGTGGAEFLGDVKNVIFSGNSIGANSQGTANTYGGLSFGADIGDVKVIGNYIGTPVYGINNVQLIGLTFSAGTGDRITVTGNTFLGDTTPYSMGATGANVTVSGNSPQTTTANRDLQALVAAGAAPTVSGRIAYDSSTDTYVGGANGATVTFATNASPALQHNVLSATHPDSTSASAARGDLITGQGASPKWARLAKGTQYQLLTGGADEPAWGAVALAQATAVSGILGSANGGTGNGFAKFAGPTTAEKTFTLPDASATVLTSNAAVTVAQGGTGITSGTSGGVPYYSASGTIASSAALAAGKPVLGGGAGTAPYTTTAVPVCATYTVAYNNAAFIAGAAAVSVTLAALPARAKVTGVNIKHSAQYTDGAGAMSEVTVSLGDGSNHTAYSAAQGIGEATAVADTTFTDTAQFKSTTMASSNLIARFLSTGRDFGTGAATYLTAGSVAIAVCTVTLP